MAVNLTEVESIYNKFMEDAEGSEGLVLQTIQSEYKAGRIKGTEYATVFLGAIQTAMQLSLDSVQKQEQIAADIALKEEQTSTEQFEQQALKAKIEDENGVIITEDSAVDSTSQQTKHHWMVEKLKEDAAAAAEKTALTAEQVTLAQREIDKAVGELHHEFNMDTTGYTFSDPVITADTTPSTKLEIALLKSKIEAMVGTKTADGYEADSYYKQFRSLQELFFSIANAGVIATTDARDDTNPGKLDPNSIYGKIVEGMEKAMNNQSRVWNPAAAGIDLNDDGGVDADIPVVS